SARAAPASASAAREGASSTHTRPSPLFCGGGRRGTVAGDVCRDLFANLRGDLVGEIAVFFQVGLGVFAPLTDPRLTVRVPRAALTDDVAFERDVEDRAHLADAVSVGDVELRLTERRRDLVLDDFNARTRTDDLLPDLDLLELAHVQPDRRVEFERAAARRRFGASEHHADLFAQLVDEDHYGFAAGDRGG